jgi:O-antigen/teichoic acid export membrane protein
VKLANAMNQPQVVTKPGELAKRTAWLTAGKIIGMALNILLPVVLVRRLTQSEYGTYKQAFQVITTMVSLLGLQVSGSVYYFFPREPKRKAQVAMNATIFYLAIGAVVATMFASRPDWVTLIFKGDDLAPAAALLGLTIMLYLVASNFDGVMISDGAFRLASVMTVILNAGKTVLLLAAAFWRGDIRSLVYAAMVFGLAHCAAYFVYLYRRFGRFWRPIDRGLLKTQLANALPYGVGGLVMILQSDLHYYFVSHYFDAAEFAIYTVGTFQLPFLLMLLDSVDTILIPEITVLEKNGAYHEIIEVWMGGVRLLAFCFAPACALMFVMRDEFITALFTGNYLASTSIFAVSLCNLLLLMNLTGPVLRCFTDFRFYRLRLCLVLLPLTWVALLAGLRIGGLVGVMAAVLLVRLVDVVVTTAFIGRKLGMSRRDFRYLTPLLRTAAAAAFAATVTLVIKQPLESWPPLLSFLTCSCVFGLVYLIAAFVIGAVTDAERAALQRLLGKFLRPGASRADLSSTHKL